MYGKDTGREGHPGSNYPVVPQVRVQPPPPTTMHLYSSSGDSSASGSTSSASASSSSRATTIVKTKSGAPFQTYTNPGGGKPPYGSYYSYSRSRSSGSSYGSASSSWSSTISSVGESQTASRVAVIGLVLAAMHIAGVLVSLYYLIERGLEPDMPEKAVKHVCTTALFCPLYTTGGMAGIAIQFSGSVLGLTLNLFLLMGVFIQIGWAVLLWLLCYTVAICGCVLLFGVMINTLVVRQEISGDVSESVYLLTLIPLAMAVLYTVCWVMVLALWKKIKRRENRVFVCVE